jgi:hypothetical protein
MRRVLILLGSLAVLAVATGPEAAARQAARRPPAVGASRADVRNRLVRYAAPSENVAPAAGPHNGLDRAERGKKILANQARAPLGTQGRSRAHERGGAARRAHQIAPQQCRRRIRTSLTPPPSQTQSNALAWRSR